MSTFTDDFYMNFKIIFCVINIQWACDIPFCFEASS